MSKYFLYIVDWIASYTYMYLVSYSLFYKIQRVAFFNFLGYCLIFLCEILHTIFFHFPSNIPEKLVEFCCVFLKTIWHVIKYQNKRSYFTITVKQELYQLSNGLTQPNST